MNLFPRFSTLSPREWAIVLWFFASLGYLVWIRFPLVVYRSVLW